MRDFFCAIAILTLLISCSSKSKNENINDSDGSTIIGLTGDEQKYLTKRNSYIEQLQKRIQRIQTQQSATDSFDSLNTAERQAMSALENMLKKILKTSRFSDNGKINLETLFASVGFGFGMLDGLSFREDSTTRIFYTTKNLCFSYLKTNEKESPFDKLSPDAFANIFNSTFQSEAHVENYSFIKLPTPDNILAYGMVAGVSQNRQPFPPQHIYAFVSADNFVYMAEIELKDPIKEIPKCKSVWDSLHAVAERNLEAYRTSDLKDTTSLHQSFKLEDLAFKKYCDCYNRELKNYELFVPVQKQMELIATYLIRH